MQNLDYTTMMNSFEFIHHPSSSFSPSISLLLSSNFSSLSYDLENSQVLVKRDSIFIIIFSTSFLTFWEFKLEKISRFPPKKLQVSV